jgi:predicted metal-binding protein
LANREGAFARYAGGEIELVGYTTCDGCPGGNVEYAPAEMKKNGADVVHLATGLVVGYPPCPFIDEFKAYIEEKFDMEVVVGTHPIPKCYYETHHRLGTWDAPSRSWTIHEVVATEAVRRSYD